jgi:four helix bundle protein
MHDLLENNQCYGKARHLWTGFWSDFDLLKQDLRGREIARQMTRSVGSISANIEEGFGRGYGREYIQFLRYARGSARESKGWYERGGLLLPSDVTHERIDLLNEIIAMQNGMIVSLERKLR